MKKAAKAWLITAAFLVLAGCILFAGVMSTLGWDFAKLSTARYETNIHEISETFSDISLTTDTADIVFALSNDGKCRVECYEPENAKHSAAVANDTLIIEINEQKSWYDYIGFQFGSPRITVYLPEARLAVSRAHHGVREFRTAYEECTAALDTVDGGTVFAEEIEGGGAWNYTEDSVQTMQLVKALKAGDDAVLDRARAMFAAIPHSDGPEYVWRYAAFHIAEYFQRIIRRTEYPLDEMEMARITGGESLRAVCELLCDLLSRVCESQRQQGMTAYQEKTREIIAYIDESCCDSTFDLNRIAENYGVTVPTASRILKEMLGVNFRSYLRTLRLEKAKRLLAETDLTVQEIAERVGFASQSYFIHVFKSAGDGTPAGYRAAVRGEREEKSV